LPDDCEDPNRESKRGDQDERARQPRRL